MTISMQQQSAILTSAVRARPQALSHTVKISLQMREERLRSARLAREAECPEADICSAPGQVRFGATADIGASANSPQGQVDIAHHPDCHSRNESRTDEHSRYYGRAKQNYSQRIRNSIQCPSYHADEATEHPIECIQEEQEH